LQNARKFRGVSEVFPNYNNFLFINKGKFGILKNFRGIEVFYSFYCLIELQYLTVGGIWNQKKILYTKVRDFEDWGDIYKRRVSLRGVSEVFPKIK
jgi:hypothetical protein